MSKYTKLVTLKGYIIKSKGGEIRCGFSRCDGVLHEGETVLSRRANGAMRGQVHYHPECWESMYG